MGFEFDTKKCLIQEVFNQNLDENIVMEGVYKAT